MLVITRKINEAFQIGGNILVSICDIQNGRVSLGIQAPTDLRISRLDSMEQIKTALAVRNALAPKATGA